MSKWPKIHALETVAKSRLFHIETMDLEFSNGARREYERLKSRSHGAVMILALKDEHTMLLINEYAAGIESYHLGFPKGLIEAGEEPVAAANRELREEVGFAARKLRAIGQFSLAPGYLSHVMTLVLAEDLYPAPLQGDEPEPIEVIEWPIDQAAELLQRPDFSEARSIAALYMLEQYLKGE